MTFQDWTLAAAIESELVRVEADQGRSVFTARRPLTDRELQSKARFGDIDAIVTTNTEAGNPIIDVLYAAVIAAVLVEVFGTPEGPVEDAVEVAALAALIYWILSDRTPTYRGALADAQPALEDLIGRSYTGGALTVMDEARRQGLNTTEWDAPGVPTVAGLLAADIAAHPLNRTMGRLLTELQSPRRVMAGTITRGELQEFLAATSRAGTRDLFSQANQSALALGRIHMVRILLEQPTLVVASEILDTNTCGPCKVVDGREYDDLEEAAEDYPSGYLGCLGGSRCRGVLVFIWGASEN